MKIKYSNVTLAASVVIKAECLIGLSRYRAAIHIPLRRLATLERPHLYLRDEYRKLRQMIYRLINQPEKS